MRKFLLAATAVLSLAATAPSFSQGLQMPNAANADGPPGTPYTSNRAFSRHGLVRHRRPARHPVASSRIPAAPGAQSQ